MVNQVTILQKSRNNHLSKNKNSHNKLLLCCHQLDRLLLAI